jgi:hypothetical protein
MCDMVPYVEVAVAKVMFALFEALPFEAAPNVASILEYPPVVESPADPPTSVAAEADSFGDCVCKPTYTLAGAVKLVVPNMWSNSLFSAKSDNADIIVSPFIKVFC